LIVRLPITQSTPEFSAVYALTKWGQIETVNIYFLELDFVIFPFSMIAAPVVEASV
jgi:hypothetical protein